MGYSMNARKEEGCIPQKGGDGGGMAVDVVRGDDWSTYLDWNDVSCHVAISLFTLAASRPELSVISMTTQTEQCIYIHLIYLLVDVLLTHAYRYVREGLEIGSRIRVHGCGADLDTVNLV